jgi:hypothetical protein
MAPTQAIVAQTGASRGTIWHFSGESAGQGLGTAEGVGSIGDAGLLDSVPDPQRG